MQIYAEAESNTNEFVRFVLPRRYSINAVRQIYAEAESRANKFALSKHYSNMRTLSAYLINLPFRLQAEKRPTARQKLKKIKEKY